MLGIVSEDENQNKIFKPMAGATLGQGVPLGAWCSFEKDVAPSSNWLMAGSSFNANTYPALALYLGTNQVPSRYDHNRPSDWEEVASTNTFTPAYDGFMAVSYYNSGVIIKVNDVQIDIDNSPSNANGNMTLPFKKGDVITFFNVYDGSARAIAFKVRYYTHPLFIKATSIASDSDKDSILAQIQEYNTYSTEETLTGKTVIVNGVRKPVYRKYTQFMKDGSYINGCSITDDQLSGVMPADYDFIVTYELTCRARESSNYFWDIMTGSRTYNKRINIYETNGKATTVYVNTGYIIYDGWFYIEYTKTTD